MKFSRNRTENEFPLNEQNAAAMRSNAALINNNTCHFTSFTKATSYFCSNGKCLPEVRTHVSKKKVFLKKMRSSGLEIILRFTPRVDPGNVVLIRQVCG